VCLAEQVMIKSDEGEINLSVKLKELTEDSYFAVHYSFLKQMNIPSGQSTHSNGIFSRASS
jgi:hypothetical protein